jgi:hypothetical protein
MRYIKYLALLSVLILPLAHSQAQVSVGIGYGPAYGYVGGPPVCSYGYYDYYPYACAPYGYYGPDWFVGGVFIGAGPWYHSYWGHGGYWGRRDWDDRRGFYGRRWDRGRGFDRGEGFRGGFRGGETRAFARGGEFHGSGFRGNGGVRGNGGFHGDGGGGFHGGGHGGGHR